VSGGERLLRPRRRFLRKIEPGALPGDLVSGFDVFYRPRNIEDIAAALLSLSD
jgi:hypothetical protein